MAKRHANKDLNHENWDEEEEEEDPGHFVPVKESELQRRVIKKAKRFGVKAPAEASSSPFAAFSGFSSNAKSNSSTFGNSMALSSSSHTSKPFASVFGTSANMPTFGLKTDSAKSFVMEADKSTAKSCVDATKDDKITSKPITTASTSVVAAAETKEKQNGDSTHQTQQSVLPLDAGLLRNMEYYRQLQSLNESVIKWMQLHLSKNVCCDFSPVFNDYKKHLDTLNVTYPAKRKATAASTPRPAEPTDNFNFKRPSTGASSSTTPKISNSNNNSAGGLFKDTDSGLKGVEDEETDYGSHFASNTTNTSTFSFGMKSTTTGTSSITPKGPTTTSEEGEANEQEKSPISTTTFSFGLKNRTDLKEHSLEAKDTKPFSFACSPVTQRFQSEASAESEPQNAEYQPPKNDFTAVAEEGASYSKKCKLFFKKDQNYAEKGVGTLHLKPLGEKMQLIIRADTNLGNILLNIMLSDTLPVTRLTKNNVLIVCVPNPPLDTKNPNSKDAIPMLIRVKTEQDADELFERLKKYMKS